MTPFPWIKMYTTNNFKYKSKIKVKKKQCYPFFLDPENYWNPQTIRSQINTIRYTVDVAKEVEQRTLCVFILIVQIFYKIYLDNIPCHFQNVHYSVERGMLGVQNQKEVQHLVLEYIGEPIQTGCESQWDSADGLVLPVMPPTLIGNCRLLQIYYVLKVT